MGSAPFCLACSHTRLYMVSSDQDAEIPVTAHTAQDQGKMEAI